MDSNHASGARTTGGGTRRLAVAVIGGSLTGPLAALLLLPAGAGGY